MKKHVWKRMLSMLLLVSMLIGILPVGVLATESSEGNAGKAVDLASKAATLLSKIGALNIPATEKLKSGPASTAEFVGTWYIVSENHKNDNGKQRFIVPKPVQKYTDAPSGVTYGLINPADITITDGNVMEKDLYYAITIGDVPGMGRLLRASTGQYYRFDDGDDEERKNLILGNAAYVHIISNGDGLYRVGLLENEYHEERWLVCNSYSFRAYKPTKAYPLTSLDYSFGMYRVSPLVTNLSILHL